MRYGQWRPLPRFAGGVRKWDYGRAVTPRCVFVHIMEGTLLGADSWFRSPRSGITSTHFGIGYGSWLDRLLRKASVWQWVDTRDTAWGTAVTRYPVSTLAQQTLGDLIGRIDVNHAIVHIEVEGGPYRTWPTEFVRELNKLLAALGAAHGPLRVLRHNDVSSKTCPGPATPWNLISPTYGARLRVPVPTPAPDELPVKFALFEPPLKARIKSGSDIRSTPDGSVITRTTKLTDPIVFVGWTRNKAGRAMWIYRIEDHDTPDPLDGRFGYVLASQGVPHERGMWVPA